MKQFFECVAAEKARRDAGLFYHPRVYSSEKLDNFDPKHDLPKLDRKVTKLPKDLSHIMPFTIPPYRPLTPPTDPLKVSFPDFGDDCDWFAMDPSLGSPARLAEPRIASNS